MADDDNPVLQCPRCHRRYYRAYGHTSDECEARIIDAVEKAWEKNR